MMFRRTVLLASVMCSLAFDSSLDSTWRTFKTHYHKLYKNEDEETARRNIFEKKVAIINLHNLEADLGLHGYRRGLNQFSDLTNNEYRRQGPPRVPYKPTSTEFAVNHTIGDESKLPTSVDWREKGYVNPVINQGECYGSWAIVAIGALEGQLKAISGNLVTLSVQNLLDCVPGSNGCSGGSTKGAFAYVIENGIDTKDCYPLEQTEDSCRFKKSCIGATMKAQAYIEHEAMLQDAIANVGPIVAGIDSKHESFQDYASGVYDEPACSSTKLDHMVLIVGYGVQDGTEYWIVKNSFGTDWGMKGYILMSRNKNNQCGIVNIATYPTGVGM